MRQKKDKKNELLHLRQPIRRFAGMSTPIGLARGFAPSRVGFLRASKLYSNPRGDDVGGDYGARRTEEPPKRGKYGWFDRYRAISATYCRFCPTDRTSTCVMKCLSCPTCLAPFVPFRKFDQVNPSVHRRTCPMYYGVCIPILLVVL